MHERKALMADLAAGFLALPGGFGTFEEFFEALTWTQLGIQHKPCGLLNVCGYYDGLIELCDRAVLEGLLKPSNRALLMTDTEIGRLLDRMDEGPLRSEPKWTG